ncbi:MAG: RagB/SusD family nutrient uptake outer membrane protein, partial [Bacteroidales bacterium]|nr:RagB/SusD family nutrient uptake outer membrane protein [Bacteroidales bacterium]
MKKFKLYSLAVAASLTMGLTSCGEDFLTEQPASQLPFDSYYNSYDRIMESVTAAYHPLQWFDYFAGWAPLNIVWDCQSDDMFVGGGSTSDQSQLHLISQYKSDPRNSIDGAWTTAYSGINRSIHVIDNAANALENGWLTDAQAKELDAEGRTLRAWYYLMLWKTWGNVPYYEQNLEYPYITDQLPADEVYAHVVADLEDLLDANALPMKREAAWAGRMTQASAAMIYADFVMYQKDSSRYAKALGYMKQIISSGQYSLVAGAEYDKLFDYEHEWSDEIILDINFISNGGTRSWGSANNPGGTVLPALIGIDGLTYENGSADFNIGGWGFCTISKEVYDAFESGDLRRDIALLNMDTYIAQKATEGVKVTYGGRYQNTGIFLRKYLGRPGGTDGAKGDADLNWENNLHLYRYAETLLNAAELALATGDGSAQGYFDQVRSRAGLPSKVVSEDAILAERRVEFVGEGKRYFDLVRTGKAASVLTAGGYNVLNTEKTAYTVQGVPERQNWTESKKYLPIPQSEIEAAQG